MTTILSREEQRQNHRKKLKHTAIEVGMLPRYDLSYFFSEMFSTLSPEKKKEVIKIVTGYQFEDAGKWREIDKYMNGCLTRHFDYAPKKVAHMCCVYMRISTNIKPQLIKRAQKIKDRIRKSILYHGLPDDEANNPLSDSVSPTEI